MALGVNSKDRAAWTAAFLIVAAFYFWIIGIGAEPKRFAWNSGLDQFYGLPGPAALENTISSSNHDMGGIFGMTAEVDPLDLAFEGFPTFPRVMEGFCDFPTTNDFYQHDLGGFLDMGLEQSWQGYQMFDA